MRLLVTSRLPMVWSDIPGAAGILMERDIQIGSSRLAAKLLVFKNRTLLRKFWTLIGKGNLGQQCRGAVNGLYTEVITVQGRKEMSHLEADKRYFCVIGLVKDHLSMEIISHESVHAGFAYAKRIRRSPWDQLAKEFDEESIAYPTGAISAAINRAIHAAGLYPPHAHEKSG